MTDRHISLDAAIEAVRNTIKFGSRQATLAALSALPAVSGCDSLQQCMNELNATKDALAEAVAEISLLESRGDRDWNDRNN